jgi:hypothetical protein
MAGRVHRSATRPWCEPRHARVTSNGAPSEARRAESRGRPSAQPILPFDSPRPRAARSWQAVSAALARGSLMAGRVHRSATWLGWQAVSAEAPHGPGVSRVARVASNGAWLTTFTSLGVRTTRYTSDARLIWSGESPDTTRVAEGHTPHVVSQSSFSTPKSTELSQRL